MATTKTAVKTLVAAPPKNQRIARLHAARDYINAHVFERKNETDGILIALLAGSSCLFIGEPGTGKTHQIRIATKLMGLTIFDTLISETTKPDSIFGPTDVPALARGIQRTKVKGYAPDSEVLFFDEIFKASGIVLNPLLWLVNEHQFRNGDEGIINCPTKAVFAASNEIPNDTVLKAIYDRFIMRFQVRSLRSKESVHAMLEMKRSEPVPELLTREDVEYLRDLVTQVVIPPEIRDAVINLKEMISSTMNIPVSDRRLFKCFQVLQARAVLYNRRTVIIADLEILASVFWDNLDQVRKVRNLVLNASSSQLSDLVVYGELAEDLWQKALKTGDMDTARERLTEMLETISKYTSIAGQELATQINEYLTRVDGVAEQRMNFNVTEILDADQGTWYKLNASCESLWSAKQLRSVGFHWYKIGSYWWGWQCFSSKQPNIDSNRKKMINAVENNMSVTLVLEGLV